MFEKLITRRRLCKVLGIHPATARRWEISGKLTAFGLTARSLRYREEDVNRLLQEALTARCRKRGPKPRTA